MGRVGRFIDRVCEEHPELMQAVLEQPLAPLAKWIDWDNKGGPCGCLIGTIALQAGATRLMPIHSPTAWVERCSGETYCTDVAASLSALWFAAEAVGHTYEETYRVGTKVANISRRFQSGGYDYDETSPESDARTVHILRQRIARSLVIRQSKDSVFVAAADLYLQHGGV